MREVRAGAGTEESARALAFLREHRGAVDPRVRRETAASLAGLAVNPELLLFFAEDRPAVAAPLIAGARLDAEDWLALLPRLGPTARSLLRHRRDLPSQVRQALAAFGASDFALEGARDEAAAAEGGESQIRELVERIEAFRRQKEERREAEPQPAAAEGEAAESFRWETGTDGTMRWIDGAWQASRAVADDGWVIEGCPVNGPAIAADGADVAVAWFTGADDRARVQVAWSGDAGAEFASPVLIDGERADRLRSGHRCAGAPANIGDKNGSAGSCRSTRRAA